MFVDIEPDMANIDADLIEQAITPRARAVLAVDAFGQPARLDEIRDIARKHDLVFIKDSCESLGSVYKGKKAGGPDFADAAVFAFYPNKQITTGEGGMIVTGDDHIAALCDSMRNQGRGEAGVWLAHERLGYNYRIDETSAALGVVQMGRIAEILEGAGSRGGDVARAASEVDFMSWFVCVIRVGCGEAGAETQQEVRDRVMRRFQEAGIGCRPYFTPIHLQPLYREQFGYREGDFPVTETVGRTSVTIPFQNRITEDEMEYVAGVLEGAMGESAGR